MEKTVRGMERNSQEQCPQMSAVLRKKKPLAPAKPQGAFPQLFRAGACRGPSYCSLQVTPAAKSSWRAEASRQLFQQAPLPARVGGTGMGPSCLQMPPLGQAPQALAACPTARRDAPSSSPAQHLLGAGASSFPSPFPLELATGGARQYLAAIWPLGFADSDS